MKILHEEPRMRILGGPAPDLLAAFAQDLQTGLTANPKRLSCRYFYDDEGSRLFELICQSPEYYVTRVETEMLRGLTGELIECIGSRPDVVELGCGSARKARILLDAFLSEYQTLRYLPIDISQAALEDCSHDLIGRFPGLEIAAVAAEYLPALAAIDRLKARPRLVLWLGSSIGNFKRDEARGFLTALRAELRPGDALLLGIDLRKDKPTLEAAYDDAAGVTARFNKNLLARANAELGADFDLDAFHHRAHYDQVEGRVEMYLDSVRAQTVTIPGIPLRVEFEQGEAVHTENSYKYSLKEIDELAALAGYSIQRQWLGGIGSPGKPGGQAGSDFSLSLLTSGAD